MAEAAPRRVVQVAKAQPASDGAGVRLWRSLGSPAVGILDPFLLLDEFRSDNPNDYVAGFPDHPHRGFETVTYMLAGAMEHRDHAGNVGKLVAGSIQWMTAGRGIVHSEMPRQTDGLMWGFQLWVNLPARLKMSPPRYQDIPPEAVPELELEGGVVVRVLAGQAGGARGPVQGISVDPTYLDIRLPAGQSFEHALPEGHRAFCYVYRGTAEIADERVGERQLAVLGEGAAVRVRASDAEARLLLIAGAPIGEPVAWYGPFVMNTEAEIREAVRDFQGGRL